MKPTLLLCFALIGCVSEDDDADLSTVEQHNDSLSMASACYEYGSTYYCKDRVTSKWCTNFRTDYGWDWTACTWSGWNDGSYCTNGWLWTYSHTHCD